MLLSTALSGGGAEQVTRSLAENLPGSVCVVFENNQGIIPTDYRLHTLPCRQYYKRSARLVFNIFRLACIQWLKLRYRPDITISHLEGPNFANLLTLKGGERVIVVHNSIKKNYCQDGEAIDRLKTGLVRSLYSRADQVVVVAPDISAELSNDYGVDQKRIRYIPNPVDVAWIKKQSVKSFGDWRDDLLKLPFLINVASLTKQKNHELLIRCFHALSDDYPDLRLFLLGKGGQEEAIRSLCTDLGLIIFEQAAANENINARVFLLGFQANPYPFIANSKIFLLPSLWEGLPISMLEAMSLRKPLIVSDCSPTIRQTLLSGGSATVDNVLVPKEGIMGRCGCLMRLFKKPADPDTITTWTQATRALLDNPALSQQCENNATTLSKEYDIANTLRYWRELVTQLTGKEVAVCECA